ncbi:MAG: sulfur carrier protein ThiS [Rickettsiales bacterium]|nr:sulfur carrier protein ThiS [Rickettsiales bacterium]
MSKINIILNGTNFSIKEGYSLSSLIEDLKLDIKKIAIEKDLQIIHPQNFETTILEEGSSLEIVHFIGGG